MTARIRKGDLVQVIAGKDRGEKGRVLQVVRADLILVEGVNRVKRHQSPRRFAEAGIVEKRDADSRFQRDCWSTRRPKRTHSAFASKPTRRDPDKRVRVAVKSGSVLD